MTVSLGCAPNDNSIAISAIRYAGFHVASREIFRLVESGDTGFFLHGMG